MNRHLWLTISIRSPLCYPYFSLSFHKNGKEERANKFHLTQPTGVVINTNGVPHCHTGIRQTPDVHQLHGPLTEAWAILHPWLVAPNQSCHPYHQPKPHQTTLKQCCFTLTAKSCMPSVPAWLLLSSLSWKNRQPIELHTASPLESSSPPTHQDM